MIQTYMSKPNFSYSKSNTDANIHSNASVNSEETHQIYVFKNIKTDSECTYIKLPQHSQLQGMLNTSTFWCFSLTLITIRLTVTSHYMDDAVIKKIANYLN
jgi:hypothetical protein